MQKNREGQGQPRRPRLARLLSLVPLLAGGLLGCEGPGPAVILRLSPLTPGADAAQLMALSGPVGGERVATELPLVEIRNSAGSLDFQDYTVGVRMPAGTAGRLVFGVATLSRQRDCLLSTGTATIDVNPIADTAGVTLPLLLTPLDVLDCGRGLRVPRFFQSPVAGPTLSAGDRFTLRGWGFPPDGVLQVNGRPATPAAWESPLVLDGTVPRLPGYLGPLDITLRSSDGTQLLEESRALFSYIHVPTFAATPLTYRSDGSSAAPADAVAADLDGSGGLDLAVLWNDAGGGRAVISVMHGGSDGVPGQPTYYSVAGSGGLKLAAAELDGKKGTDLVMATGSGQLVVFLNQGDGSFQVPPVSYSLPAASVSIVAQLALADVDHDGRIDAVVLYRSGASIGALSSDLLLLRNDGSGGFGTASKLTLSGSPYAFAVADLAAPRSADLAVTYADASGVPTIGFDLFLNNNGTLAPPTPYPNFGQELAVADLNGDGLLDLLFPHGLMLNRGGGVFVTGGALEPTKKSPLGIGDLNGDRIADVGWVEGYTLAAATGGVFQPGLRPYPRTPFLLGDLNGDKLLDVVAATGVANQLAVYLNASLAP